MAAISMRRGVVALRLGPRRLTGVIMGLKSHSDAAALKPIDRLVDDAPIFPPDLLALLQFAARSAGQSQLGGGTVPAVACAATDHPGTPWARRAETELSWGFGFRVADRHWDPSGRRSEAAKRVPNL